MPVNKLLKTLIKPVNFSPMLCHHKITDEQTKKITFEFCPFCVEDGSYCSYFDEELNKTKYDAFWRCEKCKKTIQRGDNYAWGNVSVSY